MATRLRCFRPCPADSITPVTTLSEVSDPGYVSGLAEQDLEKVRSKRQRCQDIENAMSYVRRLLHGRLDIVRGELDRRRAGGQPADLDAIIERLPSLLSEGSRSDGLPRPPQDLAPDSYAESLVADLDKRFPVSSLARVPELSVAELGALADGFADYEREISSGRSVLHDVIDTLHAEIIRRYQDGDADVDSLLR